MSGCRSAWGSVMTRPPPKPTTSMIGTRITIESVKAGTSWPKP
jgi:hypothetical protein